MEVEHLKELVGEVSIRSPHGCKGRCFRENGFYLYGRFQSAPLTDVRGDVAMLLAMPQNAEFQSAPLTDVRGDLPRFA